MWPGQKPKIPNGISPESCFDRWVAEMIGERLRPLNSTTVTTEQTSRGIKWHAAAAVQGQSQSIVLLSYVSSQDNYIVCEDASGNTINVAKPWWLRRTTYDFATVGAVKLLDAPTNGHTWTYVSHDKRTDSITGIDSPTGSPFVSDSIIWPQYAIAGTTTNPTPQQIVAVQVSIGPNAVDANGKQILYSGQPIDGTGVIDIGGNPVTYLDIGNRGWLCNNQVCYSNNNAYFLSNSPYYAQSI